MMTYAKAAETAPAQDRMDRLRLGTCIRRGNSITCTRLNAQKQADAKVTAQMTWKTGDSSTIRSHLRGPKLVC